MKKDDFKRIERQLEPDDKLIQSVMDMAEQISNDPKMLDAYLKQNDDVKQKNFNKYAFILSAAVAFLLVFGTAVYFRNNSNRIKTDQSITSKPENETLISSEQDNSSCNSDESMTATQTESKEEITEGLKPTAESLTETKEEIIDDGRAEWFPDPAAENYGESTGDAEAAVFAAPVDEFIEFELNGETYHFACGNYGEIYELYNGSKNIPNRSYIDEFITTVEIPSLYGDIRPNNIAEVYSLKYADTNFMLAVKFPNFNKNQRYYLFANIDKTYKTFAELMYALNIDKYTFNGQAINVYNDVTKYIDDDDELTQMLLSADGEFTDTVYGEVAWKTYLDTPMYGGSVSFTCYSDGYLAANVFGSELVYNVGTDTTSKITSYINENSHE